MKSNKAEQNNVSIITPFASTVKAPSLPVIVESKGYPAPITTSPIVITPQPLTTTSSIDPTSSIVGTNSKITNLPTI